MAKNKETAEAVVEVAADEAAAPAEIVAAPAAQFVPIKVTAYKITGTSEGRLLQGHLTSLPADEAAALAEQGLVEILNG